MHGSAIAYLVGTRPNLVKMAPVWAAMDRRPQIRKWDGRAAERAADVLGAFLAGERDREAAWAAV